MENVNDLLKRQLLLMKFDSGVTLKENYEKVSGKNILTEGKADVVKDILNGCDSRNNNEGRLVSDDAIYATIGLYDQAFRDTVGTNMEPFRAANSDIMKKFSYSDLCRVRDWYPSTVGELFYDSIDSDIDYDDEWQEVIDAFQAAKVRTGPTQQQGGQAPAPAPAPAPEPIANPESGDKYMKPGGLSHTFDFFKRTFPCVFAQNRVDTQEVYNNGAYDYILIVAPGGQVIQMYFDGFLREQRTLADVTYNGAPAKISCNGNKIQISGR
jgi:hypothetical protein